MVGLYCTFLKKIQKKNGQKSSKKYKNNEKKLWKLFKNGEKQGKISLKYLRKFS